MAKKDGKATPVNPLQALAQWQEMKASAIQAAKQLKKDAEAKLKLYNTAAEQLGLDLYDITQVTGLKQESQAKPVKQGGRVAGHPLALTEDQIKKAKDLINKAGAQGVAPRTLNSECGSQGTPANEWLPRLGDGYKDNGRKGGACKILKK